MAPLQLVYLGIGADDFIVRAPGDPRSGGPFACFFDESWQYVRDNAAGFYINNITMRDPGIVNSMQNPNDPNSSRYWPDCLRRVAASFRTKHVFYETDDTSNPGQDRDNIDLLLQYFEKVSYACLNYIDKIPIADGPKRVDGLRHRDQTRPVLAQTGPWFLDGDIASNSPIAVKTRLWIEYTDGSATDGPVDLWEKNTSLPPKNSGYVLENLPMGMQEGSRSLVQYSHARGKLAMVMIAPRSATYRDVGSANPMTGSEFLRIGKECVHYHEAQNAIQPVEKHPCFMLRCGS